MSVYLQERSRPPDTFADFATRQLNQPKKKAPPKNPAGASSNGVSGDPLIKMLLGLIGPAPSTTFLTDDQIRAKAQQDVNSILGPLIDREQNNYLARLQAGMGAIQGYTSTFADRVGALGPQVQQLFAGNQSLTDAIGNGLAGAQGKANMGNVNALASALQQMGAPNPGGTVKQQEALSANGTRVTKTLSADELQRLATEGGASAEFMGKLPGIAGLTGGQYARDFTTSLNNSLGEALSSINSSAPALIQQIIGDYYGRQSDAQNAATSRNLNVAQLIASVYGSNADRALNASIFNVKSAQTAAALQQKIDAETHRHQEALARAKTAAEKAAENATYHQNLIMIAQQNADANTTRANKPATTKDPAAAAYAKAVALASSHKRRFDSYGDPISGTGTNWQLEYRRVHSYLRGLLPKVPESTIIFLTNKALSAAGIPQRTAAAPTGGGGSTVTKPPPVRTG